MSTSIPTSPLPGAARWASPWGGAHLRTRRIGRSAIVALAAGALAACGGPVDEQGASVEPGILARGGTAPAASGLPLTFSPAAITAGQPATVTVTLPSAAMGASGSVGVYLTLPAALLAGPKVISIPNGARTGSFVVHSSPFVAAP